MNAPVGAPVTAGDVVRRAPHVAWTDEGRVVLLDLADIAVPPVALGDSAAAIWCALDGRRDLAEVARVVADQFGTTAETVHAEVVAFVQSVVTSGLAESGGPAGSVG